MSKVLEFIKVFSGKSLKDYARESREKIYMSIPPELVLMQKGVDKYNRIPKLDLYQCTGWARDIGIDTTYFAYRIYDLLGKSLEGDGRKDTMDFVRSLYDENKKGFVQTKFHKSPSLHAIHSAIGIVNLFYTPHRIDNRVDWSKPIGREILQEYLGKDRVDSITNFILHDCRRSGGFSESQKVLPTINATASALWCLWQLGALDLKDNENIMMIQDFVKKNMVSMNDMIGFSNEEKNTNAWVCSTYYTFRILKVLGLLGHETTIEFKRENVISFLLSCKDKDSGFSDSNTGEYEPTVVHTKDALSVICDKKYGLDYNGFIKKGTIDKEMLTEDIGSFLNKCLFEGVYGFAETNYYFPNIYATLLAIGTKQILKKMKGENSDEVVDEDQRSKILSFLDSCKCKDEEKKGGFRGYSYDPNYIPDKWWETEKSNRVNIIKNLGKAGVTY